MAAITSLARRDYRTARTLVLGVGLAVLALVVVLAVVRGVDTPEVVATALFVPVFVAFLFGGLRGGLVAGLVAAVVYGVLRLPAIEIAGTGAFASLLTSRALAFVGFGALGGLATSQLRTSLEKLDLYDEVDDATGLGNARSFLTATELELARATRYRTLFSVVVLELRASAFGPVSGGTRARVLLRLGSALQESLRTVDHAAHAVDGDRHVLALVLPETAAEGAEVLRGRLEASTRALLEEHGAQLGGKTLTARAFTLPGAERSLRDLRAELARVERREHPETAHA
jgi:GGDEF domain-containing protein